MNVSPRASWTGPRWSWSKAAEISMNADPGCVVAGVISDIGAVLDPQIRTAKVRIQVNNPDTSMRVGMFATATLHGKVLQTWAQVPASAVLHLRDRDWVYMPASKGIFRRVAVEGGEMLPGGMQEIKAGVGVGQQV